MARRRQSRISLGGLSVRCEREVGRARLELATNALKGRCSTIELPTLPQKGTREVTGRAARSKCELHEVAGTSTALCFHVTPYFKKNPHNFDASRTSRCCVLTRVAWMEADAAVAFPNESTGVYAADCVGKIGGTLALLQQHGEAVAAPTACKSADCRGQGREKRASAFICPGTAESAFIPAIGSAVSFRHCFIGRRPEQISATAGSFIGTGTGEAGLQARLSGSLGADF